VTDVASEAVIDELKSRGGRPVPSLAVASFTALLGGINTNARTNRHTWPRLSYK